MRYSGEARDKKQRVHSSYRYPDYLKNKKVLVMGLGLHGGGVGTVNFLLKAGAAVIVTDLRSKEVLAPSLRLILKHKNLSYALGEHRKKDFSEADLIVKGPGIPPHSPFLRQAVQKGVAVTNDIAIFLKECPARVIGITGTRGKSTVSFLIWKFLRTKYKKAYLAGNIRKSVLELLPLAKKNDWIVLELSSFQLWDLAHSCFKPRGRPEIAVLTNIYKDHLNWHKNFREYLRAKSAVFSLQRQNNYLFANPQDKQVVDLIKGSQARVVFPRLPDRLAGVINKNLGEHYRSSVGLAVGVAEFLGVDNKRIEKILKNFHGLEGRQQKLEDLRGVHFINDTASTMPDATVAALERFGKTADQKNKKLILIAGGQDKKLAYDILANAINKWVDALVLLPGSAAEKIKNLLAHRTLPKPIRQVKSMREAVTQAYRQAEKGDWILLSPGAASFGLFLHEFDRGEKFASEIKKLKRGA